MMKRVLAWICLATLLGAYALVTGCSKEEATAPATAGPGAASGKIATPTAGDASAPAATGDPTIVIQGITGSSVGQDGMPEVAGHVFEVRYEHANLPAEPRVVCQVIGLPGATKDGASVEGATVHEEPLKHGSNGRGWLPVESREWPVGPCEIRMTLNGQVLATGQVRFLDGSSPSEPEIFDVKLNSRAEGFPEFPQAPLSEFQMNSEARFLDVYMVADAKGYETLEVTVTGTGPGGEEIRIEAPILFRAAGRQTQSVTIEKPASGWPTEDLRVEVRRGSESQPLASYTAGTEVTQADADELQSAMVRSQAAMAKSLVAKMQSQDAVGVVNALGSFEKLAERAPREILAEGIGIVEELGGSDDPLVRDKAQAVADKIGAIAGPGTGR